MSDLLDFINDLKVDTTDLDFLACESFEEATEGFIKSANAAAIDRYWNEFRPQWNRLCRQYKAAVSSKAQKEVLWAEKQLLLDTREAIESIDENAFLNWLTFVGLFAVSFGLSSSALVPAAATTGISVLKAPAIIAQAVSTVYAILKVGGIMVKYGDSTGVRLRNQKGTGVISKQYCVAMINKKLIECDKKMQYVIAGQLLERNEELIKNMDTYVNKFGEQLVRSADRTTDNVLSAINRPLGFDDGDKGGKGKKHKEEPDIRMNSKKKPGNDTQKKKSK